MLFVIPLFFRPAMSSWKSEREIGHQSLSKVGVGGTGASVNGMNTPDSMQAQPHIVLHDGVAASETMFGQQAIKIGKPEPPVSNHSE